MLINERLRELREAKSLSQRDIEKAHGTAALLHGVQTGVPKVANLLALERLPPGDQHPLDLI